MPKPGEVTLATHGVLFLDELPEFQKNSLDILRQPLEDRCITIARVHGSYTYPSNFMLVAAMNPCSCGYYPDMNLCRCSRREINRYLGRISRPLPVSYTHLDVYKRQVPYHAGAGKCLEPELRRGGG